MNEVKFFSIVINMELNEYECEKSISIDEIYKKF